jgi:predicted adenine nucleotide alpha hydrolase (AANH) superfamily ATPase
MGHLIDDDNGMDLYRLRFCGCSWNAQSSHEQHTPPQTPSPKIHGIFVNPEARY